MFGAYRDLKFLPKEVWVISLTALVNRMGTMVLPFLVLYLTRGQGLSPKEAAVVLAVYGVGALVMGPFAGGFCDRFGPIRVMLVGLIGTGLVLLCYPFAEGLVAVAAVTLVFSLFNEVFRPAMFVVCGEVVAPEHRKQGFALVRLAVNLGMSVGPALGGFLATFSFTSLFLVDAFSTLSAAFVLYWHFCRKRMGNDKLMKGSGVGGFATIGLVGFRDAVLDRRMRYFILALIPVNIVFFQHESTLPLVVVQELGLGEWIYGSLFTLNTVLIIFLEIPLNAKTAHWSAGKSLAWGSLLITCGFFTMLFAKTTLGVLGTGVLWTFGEMLVFPASSAYVTEISPSGKRGAYMGTYSAVFSLCFILGPWVGTGLLQNFGSDALWWGCLGIGLVSVGLFARVRPVPQAVI